MSFRYLCDVNSERESYNDVKTTDTFDRILYTRNLLLELTRKDTDVVLNAQQESEAYAIIVEQLLAYTPPINRFDVTWKLGRILPRAFLPVIQYIARNCPR